MILDAGCWMLDKNNPFIASAIEYSKMRHSGGPRINDLRDRRRNPGRKWMPDRVRHEGIDVFGCRFNGYSITSCQLFLILLILSHALGNPSLAASEFKMSDSLTCTIEASSTPEEIGKKIFIAGLTTAAPQAVFENHVRSSMVKLFESEQTVVIQLVAAISGSVDTLVIDKRTGKFAHTAAGSFLEVHAIAETGSCRPE
jgi:hypothetical protein